MEHEPQAYPRAATGIPCVCRQVNGVGRSAPERWGARPESNARSGRRCVATRGTAWWCERTRHDGLAHSAAGYQRRARTSGGMRPAIDDPKADCPEAGRCREFIEVAFAVMPAISEMRVCPDCGATAGSEPFCSSCGLNLTGVARLPTKAEWEQSRVATGHAEAQLVAAALETIGTLTPFQYEGSKAVDTIRNAVEGAVAAALPRELRRSVVVTVDGGGNVAVTGDFSTVATVTLSDGALLAQAFDASAPESSTRITIRRAGPPQLRASGLAEPVEVKTKSRAETPSASAARPQPSLPSTGHASAPPAGQTLGQLTTDRVLLLVGAVVAAIGSVGPWATSPLSSASGTDGDGVITLIAAIVLGLVALVAARGARGLMLIAIVVTGGVGIYDAIHIHNEVAATTLNGTQLDHVGWGVYVVIVGAVIGLIGWIKGHAPASPAAR